MANKFVKMGGSMLEILITATVPIIILLIFKYYYDRRWMYKCVSKQHWPKLWKIGHAWRFGGTLLDIVMRLKKFHGFKLFGTWLKQWLDVHTRPLAGIFFKSSKLIINEKVDNAKFNNSKRAVFTNEIKWTKTKKLMESALTYSLLKDSIPIFQKQGELLAQHLRCQIGKPCFPISQYLGKCIFDLLAEVSSEFEEKAQKSELTILKEINIIARVVKMRFYDISHKWDFLYKFLPEGKQYYSTLDSILKFVDETVIDKMKKYKSGKIGEGKIQKLKKRIFLETLNDEETLSLSDVKDHIMTTFKTGFETTSRELSFILLMLALHPDLQEKLYQEVRFIKNLHGDFSYENIKHLKYLSMVIKETSKFPAIPISWGKDTEDIQMGHYSIPEGAEVAFNTSKLHQDPGQFHNLNYKFNPDYFPPVNMAKWRPYSYDPFSSIRQNYLGDKFTIEVKKVIVATLLLSYKFECDFETIDDVRWDTGTKLNDEALIRILVRR